MAKSAKNSGFLGQKRIEQPATTLQKIIYRGWFSTFLSVSEKEIGF